MTLTTALVVGIGIAIGLFWLWMLFARTPAERPAVPHIYAVTPLPTYDPQDYTLIGSWEGAEPLTTDEYHAALRQQRKDALRQPFDWEKEDEPA